MQATEMVVGQAKIVTGGFAIDLSKKVVSAPGCCGSTLGLESSHLSKLCRKTKGLFNTHNCPPK